MKTFFISLRILLPAICGMLLICIPFTADPRLVNGIITGSLHYFHFITLCFAGSVLYNMLTSREAYFRLTIPDILVACMLLLLPATYDWSLNPNIEKLLFLIQCMLLWFMLRYLITAHHTLRTLFVALIMLVGTAEAVCGMVQLYGLSASNNILFQMTGSFFNPGPFSGYLAVILPVSLGMILKLGVGPKSKWWQMRTALYYFSWLSFLLIFMVLPAGMSRSAWLAAAISCIWVFWKHRIGWEKVKYSWQNSRILFITLTTGIIILLVAFLAGIYYMKKDSADGRLLMWKVTSLAMREAPVCGQGLGSFPAAFIRSQAEYLSNDQVSAQEKWVAGCPEYAFNEYLHIGLEHGILGLILFVGWLLVVMYMGIKNKRYGIVGGLISLAIFAFSSYPLQLPSFWVLLVMLSTMAISGPRIYNFTKPGFCGKPVWFVPLVAALLAIGIYYVRRPYTEAYREWTTARMLYNNKAFEVAIPHYEKLYDRLKHKPEFLFESGQCLGNSGRHEEAIVVLERAARLSSDPMIHYIIAKNRQELAQYKEAEEGLYKAIRMLPERIYPYFLLTKLYACPDYYHADKLKMAADSVLYKHPKVETTAIREMRDEVKKLMAKQAISISE